MNSDDLELWDSLFTGNQSTAQGGGISLRDTPATILRTTVDGNTSGAVGSGIYAYENMNPGSGVVIDSSAITRNTGPGAAVFLDTIASSRLVNGTVSNNASPGIAGGSAPPSRSPI